MCVFLAWSFISFLVLESQPSITVVFFAFSMDCGRTSSSLLNQSFLLSSELRNTGWLPLVETKEWTFALATAPFFFPTDFHFPARAQESVDTPITDQYGKPRKVSRFLKADTVHVPSGFCRSQVSMRPSPMEWAARYESEKGPERKRAVDFWGPNNETTHYWQLAKSTRLQPKRSLCMQDLPSLTSSGTKGQVPCVSQYAVCMRGDNVSRDNTVQEAGSYFRSLGLFSFWSTPLDDQCFNLSLENPNLMNCSQNSS